MRGSRKGSKVELSLQGRQSDQKAIVWNICHVVDNFIKLIANLTNRVRKGIVGFVMNKIEAPINCPEFRTACKLSLTYLYNLIARLLHSHPITSRTTAMCFEWLFSERACCKY